MLRLPDPGSNKNLNTRTRVNDLTRELEAFRYVYNEKTKTVKMEGVGAHDDTVVALALAVYVGKVGAKSCFAVAKGSSRSVICRVS